MDIVKFRQEKELYVPDLLRDNLLIVVLGSSVLDIQISYLSSSPLNEGPQKILEVVDPCEIDQML